MKVQLKLLDLRLHFSLQVSCLHLLSLTRDVAFHGKLVPLVSGFPNIRAFARNVVQFNVLGKNNNRACSANSVRPESDRVPPKGMTGQKETEVA